MDDAYSLWQHKEAEAESWLQKRPVCADCDEHIQDEKAYYINGEFICVNCMDAYLVYVEDCIE